MDATTIRDVYEALKQAKQEYHEAVLTQIEAKTVLDSARLKGLAGGTITGKNASLRESSAFEVLAEQYSALNLALADERNVRLVLDLAQLDVNAMRDELRLLEITQ